MPRKHITFNTAEVIHRAQTEIICAFLRLLDDDKPVIIKKLYKFINDNSCLRDGFLVESVRLVNDFHYVEVTVRDVNYETVNDVDDIDEQDMTSFIDVTRSFILKEQPQVEHLRLLAFVYDECAKVLKED